jgi:hypothetical protein
MKRCLLLCLVLSACLPYAARSPDGYASDKAGFEAALRPADVFFARLHTLCGQSFAGRMVTSDPLDADMSGQELVMQVRDCSRDEVRIPFHVGQDRSRTWVITRMASGLRLQHVHRHTDGQEDALSGYGGEAMANATQTRQEFPADAFSKELFRANDRSASISNVWAVEVDESMFAYELRRPQRFFRIEFNLGQPLTAPLDP